MDDKDKKKFHVAPVDAKEKEKHPKKHSCKGGDRTDSNFLNVLRTLPGDENVEGDDQSTYQPSHLKTWTSLRYHLTREALPKLDHYRNIHSIVGKSGGFRPTLDDLRNPVARKSLAESIHLPDDAKESAVKFGWIKGVLVRCLLNIWSVILFLRLSWVAGQAGILEGIAIILAGNVVTTITALSMSAISTNGQIKGGGTYYMISRSLGPEFGSAIGLIFSFANAVAVSMNVVGFCESLIILLKSFDVKIVDAAINDIRIIGSATLVVLFIICAVGGMAWEARAQVFLLVILLLAIFDYLIGCFIGPLRKSQIAMGFVGFNETVLLENLFSNYRYEGGKLHNAISVFAVFFPACTGILAGANISGDLKDPSSAIPKGTLLAIFTTGLSYIIILVMVGASVVRDATGIEADVDDGTFLDCTFGTNSSCPYGLLNSFMVLELESIFGPLIYAGCFAATLSSALACLVSAPKLFQALCKDNLFPYIHVFGKGYGKGDEPFKAYILAGIIALAFIILGDLNSIAPIISNFFMAAYALINFSCFHASLQRSPGWRPTFKYYNMWLSLFGSVLCTGVMILMNWWTALLTAAIILILYLFVCSRKLDVNWGSSLQGQTYCKALAAALSLDKVDEHVKTFRPQILLLCGAPSHRPPLIHFANNITKNMSLLIAAEWPTEGDLTHHQRSHKRVMATKWLHKEKMNAFFVLADNGEVDVATKSLMASVGLGKLRPNIVMMGFKADWRDCCPDELKAYYNIIHATLDSHLGLCILRVPGKLDYSNILEVYPTLDGKVTKVSETAFADKYTSLTKIPESPRQETQERRRSSTASSIRSSCSSNINEVSRREEGRPTSNGGVKSPSKKKAYLWEGGEMVSQEVLNDMLRYTVKQPKGTIDVWWLFDDGGLTLLLPYILTTRAMWSDCSLRIFCLAGKNDDLEEEHRRIAELICKFRIAFSDVVLITDISKPPKEASIDYFNDLIAKFRKNGTESQEDINSESCHISDEELLAAKDKTRRHIRLKELLVEHSKNATLIVMTLPIPTKGGVSAPLYQAWLETLTKDLPPFLLVRGNQTSVLTYYS